MVKVPIFMSTGHLHPFLCSEDGEGGLHRNVSKAIRLQIPKEFSTQNGDIFHLSLILKFTSLLYALLEFILEITSSSSVCSLLKLYVILFERRIIILVVSTTLNCLVCLLTYLIRELSPS
jgi:hypothetical protein